MAASSAVRKYPLARPQSRMVSTTRVMSCRTPVSRSGVPIFPCRYFEATMLVAVMDQSLGTSTFFCSKMGAPCASVISAVRSSHSTSSYGDTPALVKKSCHPEQGRALARFLQGGKPESKDLGFRHTTIAKIPLETPVAPACPHQPLSFGGAGLQPCHQPQKKPVASTLAAPRNRQDRNPPAPSPAPLWPASTPPPPG